MSDIFLMYIFFDYCNNNYRCNEDCKYWNSRCIDPKYHYNVSNSKLYKEFNLAFD